MLAQATSPIMARNQTLPWFVGPRMRLAALSLLVRHKPAHDARCAGSREAAHARADVAQRGTRDGLNARNRLERLQCLLKASQTQLDLALHFVDCLAELRQLLPQLPRARSARTSGSRSPRIRSANMARPLTPRTSVATAASLVLAPSSVLWSRFTASARSCKRLSIASQLPQLAAEAAGMKLGLQQTMSQ